MAKGDYHNQKNLIIDGVNDSIVAHPKSITGPPPKWSGGWRTRIVSEKSNGTLKTRPHRAVNLSKFTKCRRPEL